MTAMTVTLIANMRKGQTRQTWKKHLLVTVPDLKTKTLENQISPAELPEGYRITGYQVLEKQYCLELDTPSGG